MHWDVSLALVCNLLTVSVIESFIFAKESSPAPVQDLTELGECDDFQSTSISVIRTSSEDSTYLPCCSSFAAVCCVYRHRLDQRVLLGHCGNRQCLGFA